MPGTPDRTRLEIMFRCGVSLEVDVNHYAIERDLATGKLTMIWWEKPEADRCLEYLDPNEVMCVTSLPLPVAVGCGYNYVELLAGEGQWKAAKTAWARAITTSPTSSASASRALPPRPPSRPAIMPGSWYSRAAFGMSGPR
jgi:hypothetical protein